MKSRGASLSWPVLEKPPALPQERSSATLHRPLAARPLHLRSSGVEYAHRIPSPTGQCSLCGAANPCPCRLHMDGSCLCPTGFVLCGSRKPLTRRGRCTDGHGARGCRFGPMTQMLLHCKSKGPTARRGLRGNPYLHYSDLRASYFTQIMGFLSS